MNYNSRKTGSQKINSEEKVFADRIVRLFLGVDAKAMVKILC
jgi:hypothetical protein